MVPHIYKDNIHIDDSYTVRTKSEMNDILNQIREEYTVEECDVLKFRTNKSMIREWRTHNHLYNLHVLRERTKDVDLNYPQKWYIKVAYFLLGW